jgi:hypothetical protein
MLASLFSTSWPLPSLARLSQLEGVGDRKLLQIKATFQKVCTKAIPARVVLSA